MLKYLSIKYSSRPVFGALKVYAGPQDTSMTKTKELELHTSNTFLDMSVILLRLISRASLFTIPKDILRSGSCEYEPYLMGIIFMFLSANANKSLC